MTNQLKVSKEMMDYARTASRNYYTITNMFNILGKHVNAYNNFGYKIDIAKSNDDLIITPTGTLERKRYYAEMGFTDRNLQEIEAYLNGNDFSRPLVLTDRRPAPAGKMMTLVKKDKVTESAEIVFFISFFEKHLLPMLNDAGVGFGIVKGDKMIALKANAESAELERLILDKSVRLQDPGVYGYTKANDQGYSVHMTRSDVLGNIGYVYVTRNDVVKSKLMPMILDAAKVYGLLILLGIGLALIMTNRMYKPVRHIVNAFKGIQENPGQDELTYIRETALQIKKANEILRETIRNNRLPLRNKFVRDLILGLLPAGQIDGQLEKYELQFLKKELTVVILEFAVDDGREQSFSKEAILEINARTVSLVEEKLKPMMECETLEWDYRKHVLILQETDTAKIKKALSHALSAIETDFGIRLVAAIGQPVPSVHAIDQSFHTALSLLEYRFASDKRTVITLHDLDQLKQNGFYYPLDLERELISLVIQGKRDKVDALLTRILDENFKRRRLSPEKYSQFIFAVVATVNRILQQLNKSEHDFFEPGTLHISELKVLDDAQLEEKIRDIYSRIITVMNSSNEEQDHSIADQMTAFIHENYNKDLSLHDLADLFGFSIGYISILFKNYVGENFKDYLNHYRVTKAKELMQANPNLTVNQISGMVGFNHANTFIRIFKKYEGMPPGMFARKAD
jgi:AraC-like DNA-binding protein